MKHEIAMKVMAYLDGELSRSEAREIAVLVERDEAARGLYQELRTTRDVLKANEPVAVLPESREFFWNKLERALLGPDGSVAKPAASWAGWLAAWRRWLVPAAAAAVLLGLGLSGWFHGPQRSAWSLAEVETLSDEVNSHSFLAGGMLVVWVENKNVYRPEDWEPTEPPAYQ